jgi:hypothetical protein
VHRWNDLFDPGSSTFRGANGRIPDWLVLPESPLDVYTSVPPSLRGLAASRYVLAQSFEATRGPSDAAVYDQQDAFFMPVSGFNTVVRPGPTLRIYRRAGLPDPTSAPR